MAVVSDSRVTKLEAETRALKQADVDLGRDQRILQGLLASLQTDVIDIKTRVMSIESGIHGLKTDLDGLKTDVDGLKTDVGGLKTDVTGLKTDVTGLKTDMAEVLRLLRNGRGGSANGSV